MIVIYEITMTNSKLYTYTRITDLDYIYIVKKKRIIDVVYFVNKSSYIMSALKLKVLIF